MGLKSSRNKPLNLIEVYLPFYYLLSQYNVLLIGAGAIGLLIVALLTCSRNGYVIHWHKTYKYFSLFIGYVIIRQLLTIFAGFNDSTTVLHSVMNITLSALLIVIVCNTNFDEDVLYKSWKIAGIIYVAGIIYHLIALYIIGRAVTPITILPGMARTEYSLRPLSFFQEPAAFCTAIMPLLFLALKRKKYLTATWVTLAILASTSSVGVVLSCVLWGYYILTGFEISIGRRIGIVIVLIAILIVFFNAPVFSDTISKLQAVSEGGSTWNSRVAGGFEVIASMNIFQWIFGSSMWSDTYVSMNLSKFASGSVVRYYYAADSSIFLNTFAQYLFNYGLIGFSIFVKMLMVFFKGKSTRGFIVMFIIAIFGQTYAVGGSAFCMVIIILMLYAVKESKDQRKIDSEGGVL